MILARETWHRGRYRLFAGSGRPSRAIARQVGGSRIDSARPNKPRWSALREIPGSRGNVKGSSNLIWLTVPDRQFTYGLRFGASPLAEMQH